jgi:putative FmdB family regulatory protein
MPIYEYRCVECDRSFEAFVRNGADDASCPECHGSRLTREMSTFAARGSNGDGASAAMNAIAANGGSAGRMTGGGCGGGGCGCH